MLLVLVHFVVSRLPAGGLATSSRATAGASTCSSGASTATGTSGTRTSRSCSPCAASATRSGTSEACSSAAEGRPGPSGPGPPRGAAKARRGGSRAGVRACQATLPPNLLNKAWGRPPTCHASTRHCLRGGPRGGAGEGQGEGGCGGKVLRALRGHSMPPVLIRRALIMCLSACVSIWQSVHPSILLVFLPYFYV